MTNAQFETIYPKYADVIRAIARKLSGGSERLLDDLEQVGVIALWRCNPEKATTNPDSYIRQAIKFRMIDLLRKEAPLRFDSLDELLENGQLMDGQAGAFGEPVAYSAAHDRKGKFLADRSEYMG